MTNRSVATRDHGPAGFSLLELLIALAITMMVSGAVYGLLASAQKAFRREPAVGEQQQNIRLAMDLIQRDIATAGVGMVPFVQAFSDGLDGAGPMALPAVIEPAAGRGERTDAIEIIGNDGRCPRLELCAPASAVGASLPSTVPPACLAGVTATNGSFVYVGDGGVPGRYAIEFSPGVGAGAACAGGTLLAFSGTANHNPPEGGCGASVGSECTFISLAQVVAYAIASDSDGTPALFRSPTGWTRPDGSPGGPPPGGNWELVARGIEDLQVEYRNGAGTWSKAPGAITSPDYETLVRQVRVTLSARASGRGLAGETGSAAGTALRAQLTSVTAPRAVNSALANAAPERLWE